MQPRPVFQQPYKVAQVQKSDEARKVNQELQSEVGPSAFTQIQLNSKI